MLVQHANARCERLQKLIEHLPPTPPDAKEAKLSSGILSAEAIAIPSSRTKRNQNIVGERFMIEKSVCFVCVVANTETRTADAKNLSLA